MRKPLDPDAPGRPPREDTHPKVVSVDELEEAIAATCRIYGVFVTEPLVRQYLEALDDVPREAVYEAIKAWNREPPEPRAPRPNELLARARQLQPCPAESCAERVPDPTSREDLDAIYAELVTKHPDNPLLRERIAERARRRRAGAPVSPESEAAALIAGLVRRQAMPGGPS